MEQHIGTRPAGTQWEENVIVGRFAYLCYPRVETIRTLRAVGCGKLDSNTAA